MPQMNVKVPVKYYQYCCYQTSLSAVALIIAIANGWKIALPGTKGGIDDGGIDTVTIIQTKGIDQ